MGTTAQETTDLVQLIIQDHRNVERLSPNSSEAQARLSSAGNWPIT